LSKKHSKSPTINQRIIEIVKEKDPETVEQLIKLVQSKHSVPRQKILDAIIKLQNQGKITLKQPKSPSDFTINEYIVSPKAYWYWTIIALSLATTILVFTVPENAYPIVYARYILGSIFVLWLPGYTFIKALFPTEVPIKTSSENLDKIERIALSAGMSLALVPITGLLLNYTPWGIRLTPVTLSLLALTITCATVALLREHQAQTQTS
jgi:hypothetical protein